MKTLLLSLALLAPGIACAQTTDEPKTESVVENAVGKPHEEQQADPTQHFNYTNLDWRGKDEFGGKYGDDVETTKDGVTLHEEEPMSPPFMWMLINFGILLIILGKWGAPVARKLAEERHDLIKNALDEAAKLRDQAAKKLSEYETRIKDVDTEIKALVEGIRKDAEADKVRILEAAQTQAAQMKREAEQRIAAEIDLARAQLTAEVTAAAIAATEKIVKDKATPDDQRKLVSSFISNIGAPQ
ncbi:MAG TPA: ATP synthase F0 subunit B [Kofleriaceae bacterium]|jgi:F-type H+-transporting ATPase subunit b|nr:ATP synthase F0 subunit B [Kofleriaceae bacterium]